MDMKDIVARLKNSEESFPIIVKPEGRTPSRHDKDIKLFNQCAEYLEAGVIPNARWKEVNSSIATSLEEAFNREIDKPFVWGQYDQIQPDVRDLYDSLNCSGITGMGASMKKMVKFLGANPETKSHPMVETMVSFFAEANVIVQAGELLKGMSQKREVKSEAEREAEAKYVPPMASKAAFELVNNALLKITNDSFEGLKESRINAISSLVDNSVIKSQNGVKYRDMHPIEQIVLREVCQSSRENGQLKWEKAADTQERIVAMGTREATDIRDSFVIKNLRKLASVIDKKGNLESIEIMGRQVDMNGLRGTLKMNFADNSSFQVTNQVVFTHSSLGKPFCRYPLNFHDIIKPDGELKARPSEEWMNHSF